MAEELARRIKEGAIPIISDVPGFMAYYLLCGLCARGHRDSIMADQDVITPLELIGELPAVRWIGAAASLTLMRLAAQRKMAAAICSLGKGSSCRSLL